MVKRNAGKKQSGIAAILLISFVLGSFLSRAYKELSNGILLSLGTENRAILITCFAINCILASSVNGRVFIPMLCVVFGAAIGSELEFFAMAARTPDISSLKNLIVLLISTPAYFVLSSWGVNNSLKLVNALRQLELDFTRENFFSFSIMCIGLVLLLYGQNIMLI